MHLHPSRLTFYLFLISGPLLVLSSSSWFSVWLGLEINLLSFIPLSSFKASKFHQSPLKYFLVQALASILFLIFISSFYMNFIHPRISQMIICAILVLKLGGAPLHFWFPIVAEGLSWNMTLILLTLQKLSPLYLLSSLQLNSPFIQLLAISSALIGGIGGFNQTSLRKLLAFSSINHLGWLMILSSFDLSLMCLYFVIYAFMNLAIILGLNSFQIFSLNELLNFPLPPLNKFFFFLNFLSLGGLPPLWGFLPKWLGIMKLMESGLILSTAILTLSSVLTLFFYLRTGYTAFTLLSNQPLWGKPLMFVKSPSPLFSIFSFCNLLLAPVLILPF